MKKKKEKLTIFNKKDGKGKLAFKGIDFPHFIFKSGDIIINLGEFIRYVTDRRELFKKISNGCGNESRSAI